MSEEGCQNKQEPVLYLCPSCNAEVAFSHVDDVGTSFYRCRKCGETTSTPEPKPYNPSMYRTFDAFCENDDGSGFNPIRFAKDVLDNYYVKTMKDNETVYIFDAEKGVYTADGENFIKQKMAETLELETRQHYYPDIVFYVKAKTYVDRPAEASSRIALKNGLLDVQTGLVTIFTPSEFITTRIPVAYDQGAQCPKTIKFLADVVGLDQVPLIQEWFGYCLFPKMPFHKALLLVGEGANGKSTLLELLRRFLGAENISTTPLQALMENRFATAQLHGKLANICADLTDKPLTKTGLFKLLTGNDPITAEQKFKQPFTFVNHAKLTFSANKVPETSDDTPAFFRRWIIVTCGSVFSGEKCDPKILDKVATPEELSGLLNWSMDGLKRLLERGSFSQTESMEDQRSQYIRKSNSARAFIEEMLAYSPDVTAFIPEAELYEKYVMFCQANSLPSTRKAVLTQNIHQYLPQAKQTKERIGKDTVHVWQYVQLQEPASPVPTVPTSLINHTNTIILREQFENSKVWLNKSLGTLGTKQSEPFFASCYCCGKPILTDDWVTGEASANKPCHRECFEGLVKGVTRNE